MSRFLMVDIGAGTMDILYYDSKSDLHYKAVVKSPVQTIAEKAFQIKGDLLVTGCEMGGGPITRVLKQKASDCKVIISFSASATLHHNPEKIRHWNIEIIDDHEAEDLRIKKKFSSLILGDIDMDRLEKIVRGFGVPFSFDILGICAQDHGTPPQGVSHLDFRHKMFTSILDQTPVPQALLYKNEDVPKTMNRLTSIAKSTRKFPADEIYIMDSGMAAILGASMDSQVKSKKKVLLLDMATSHTIGAAMEGDAISGFFEYHTADITVNRLEMLLHDLAEGKLVHNRIVAEGGHGAYTLNAFGFESAEIILATGPKRKLLKHSNLPIVFGAPLGDNMMTGTVGLLEAVRRRKRLSPVEYL